MRFKTSYHLIVDAVLGIQAFSTICALQLIVYQGTSKYQMMVVVDLRTRDAVPFLANAILTERPLNATTTSDNPAYSTIASWTQKKRFARQIYWWSCFLLVQQQDLHAFKICWKMADKHGDPGDNKEERSWWCPSDLSIQVSKRSSLQPSISPRTKRFGYYWQTVPPQWGWGILFDASDIFFITKTAVSR